MPRRRRRPMRAFDPAKPPPRPAIVRHVRRDLTDPDGRVHRGVRVPVYGCWTDPEELPGTAASRCAARETEARAIRQRGVRL